MRAWIRYILLLTLYCAVFCAPRAYAQPTVAAQLTICNHGTITVDAYVAKEWVDLRSSGWQIKSVRVLPGRCAVAYESSASGTINYGAEAKPAYIGFSFADARGQWGAGSFQQLPDIGFVNYVPAVAIIKRTAGHPALTSAAKKMCVRRGPTSYSISGDLEVDCATFRVTDADRGQWTPLLSSFYFLPNYGFWPQTNPNLCADCGLRAYYLNIAAVPNSRVMAGERGSAGDAERDSVSTAGGGDDAAKQLKAYAQEQRDQDYAGARSAKIKELEARAAAGDQFAMQALGVWKREEQERAAAPRDSPAAYNLQWDNKHRAVRGTVARIKVEKGWLTLYFKESPAGEFVICTRSPAIFAGNFGEAYRSDLIGKTIEVDGIVEGSMCTSIDKASIKVVESGQVRLLASQ